VARRFSGKKSPIGEEEMTVAAIEEKRALFFLF
jgi:hypothetical protein